MNETVNVSITDSELMPLYKALDEVFAARDWNMYEAATVFVILAEKFIERTNADHDEFWKLLKAGEGSLQYQRAS